jgi:hypothetical protein
MNYFKDAQNKTYAFEDADLEKVAEYEAAKNEDKAGYPQVFIEISEKLKELTPIDEAEKDILTAPTPEQLKEKDIAEAKQYLAESDWIVTKIAEADIEGRDTTDLKAKYIDKLSHRKLMREVINSAESE